jgi:hypothetical protein
MMAIEQQLALPGGDVEPPDKDDWVAAVPLLQLRNQRVGEAEDGIAITVPLDELVPAIHQRLRGRPRRE